MSDTGQAKPPLVVSNILSRTISEFGTGKLKPLDEAFLKLRELGLLDKSGSALSSSEATLREGPCYFLGLNPGGDDESEAIGESEYPTIAESLALSRLGCNGFDQDWSRDGASYPAGGAPMQNRFKFVCTQLRLTYSEVFATNFVFPRSRNVKALKGFGGVADACGPIHEIFLRAVKPRFIWLMGNPETAGLRLGPPDWTWEKFDGMKRYIGRGVVELWGRKMPAFHTPHLSFWKPQDNMTALEWAIEEARPLVARSV